MTDLPDFDLALNLINNIVVFNETNEEIFTGEEIKKILVEFGFADGSLLVDTKEEDKLVEKINEAREKRIVIPFKFSGIDVEFFIFPLTYQGNNSVVLSAQEGLLELNRVQRDLKERVKEIECLYNVSYTLESSATFDEALEKCTIQLEEGFLNPRKTFVNFKVGDKFFGVVHPLGEGNCKVLKEDIKLNNKKRGEINVSIPKELDFLKEEEVLLKEVSGKISRAIEKDRKARTVENARKVLLSKNRDLIELTKICNANRERLRTFFNAIDDKIYVIDKDFNIVMSNNEEIGESGKCYEKVFKYKKICDNCTAIDTFSEGRNTFFEKQYNDQNFTLRAYPIFDDNDNVNQVLEVCHDSTMQKQIETQLIQSYKLASLGKLVAGVAHEINNPNTFILGNLKIIDEAFNDILPILDKYQQENPDFKVARLNYEIFKENIPILIKDMVKGANRTNKIVSDLRNFARKDEGKLSDNVDINYIIKNNLTLTQKHIKKIAKIDFNLGDDIPKFKGSIQKLEQVLLNLITNAAQAIENGNGKVIIETLFEKKSNEVLIKIIDNGKGMDEKTLKNIFDPFYTTKRNKGGTGLGLSISYGIIKEHHGNITVDSKVDEGTTFTIKIPVS
jgi:signal transduction histidine kinase/PAS domain-containing protein